MRTIDADALKEFIDNGRVCDICPNKKPNCVIHCDFPDYLTPIWEKVIDNIPTVDTTCPNCDSGYAQGYSDGYLKERPQGEWLTHRVAFHLTCPFCGCNLRALKDKVFEGDYEYNFCPNCGAKMTKEAENEENEETDK